MTRNSMLILGSKFFERFSYYGFSAILVLHLINSPLGFERNEAFHMFITFKSIIPLMYLIGAVLGDIILGNRRSIIIGLAIQLISMITLLFEIKDLIFPSLIIYSVGSGIYFSNIISSYAKSLIERRVDSDVGFIIYYLIINMASMLGTFLIAYTFEKVNFKNALAVCMIAVLISTALGGFVNTSLKKENYQQVKVSVKWSMLILILIGLAVLVVKFLIGQKQALRLDIIDSPSFYTFPFEILFFIYYLLFLFIWNKYNSSYWKLLFGILILATCMFLFAGFKFDLFREGIILVWFFLPLLEIHLLPLVLAFITRVCNYKYLTMGLSLIIVLIGFAQGFAGSLTLNTDPLSIYGFITVLVLILFLTFRKNLKSSLNER